MEEEFLDIKKLYQSKASDSLLASKVSKREAQDNLKGLKKRLFQNIATFIITAAAIIYIDFVSSAIIVTSAIGFWIMLFCAIYYAGSKVFLLYRLKRINSKQPVLKVIEQLDSYKSLNAIMLTYGELLYILLLSIGVYLYIIPIANFMSAGKIQNYFVYFILVWIGYILWIILNTFYLKRKKLLKENQILKDHIQYLKSK